MRKLLFLCIANYYRSRFAEMLFNHLAVQCQLNWVADSRGIATVLGADNADVLSEHTMDVDFTSISGLNNSPLGVVSSGSQTERIMKKVARFLGVAAVAVGISFLVSTALADSGYGPRMGQPRSGGWGNNFRYGGRGGGYSGGYHGGFDSGFHHRNGGWGGWYPWNFSFSYIYSPPPYYYYDYYPQAVYYSPPVVYSSEPAQVYYSPPAVYDSSQPAERYNSPPAVYNSGSAEGRNSPPPSPTPDTLQQPAVDRPLSPTAVDREDSPPVTPRRAQRPPTVQRGYQGQSLGVADVRALAKAGVSEDIILSQIRNSHAVYRLSTAEIIELKESGVSEKIIDFMINTASASSHPRT
jgi:hypothetical protein